MNLKSQLICLGTLLAAMFVVPAAQAHHNEGLHLAAGIVGLVNSVLKPPPTIIVNQPPVIAPQPVYVAPQPVVIQPPVVVAPPPMVIQQPVYVAPQPVYVTPPPVVIPARPILGHRPGGYHPPRPQPRPNYGGHNRPGRPPRNHR